MAIDQPLVVHLRDKSKGPSKRQMNRLAEEWYQKRQERESLVGKKVSLKDLLTPKKEVENG